jgi:hypothetical protein
MAVPPATTIGCGSVCRFGDFTRWKDHDAYQKALDRLLRNLRVRKALVRAARSPVQRLSRFRVLISAAGC